MKKNLAILVVVVFLMTLCCPGAFAEGEKLSDQPVTLELMVYEHASVPWLENPVVLQEIFERTNVQLEITAVPPSSMCC